MKTNQELFTAKDHLVTAHEFKVIWNEEKNRAETQIPPGTDLSKYYKSKDYLSHANKKKSLQGFIYFFIQNLMFHFKKSLIKRHSLGLKLLDYGSGVGNFAEFMSHNAYNVFAIEPNSKAMKISINKGINTFLSLKTTPKSLRFSIITLWHVLEHVLNLKLTLKELRSCLDKRGKLFIAVPNFKSFDSLYYKSNWAALDVPRHLWHFTTPGIQSLMEEAGFEMVDKRPLWFDSFYIAYLSEQHLGNRWPMLKGLFIGLISNIKAFFSGEYSSIIYVFEKKTNLSED